jgi:hypothetical protein
MTLRSYNPHTRYKERAAQRFAALMGYAALTLISILIGFWLGKQYGATELITLKDEIVSIKQERDLLQSNATELSAAAQTANMRFEQLQEEVESIIPKGPMQNIATLVRDQLKKGTDPERLAFVIRSARPPTGCVDPQNKRFVVSTPAYNGPASAALIADGLISITGTGSSARNEKKQPEAWYDPAKRVKITFKYGDKIETKAGTLPMRYSIVAEDREYRFSIEAGARSFAKVVYDSCAYP